MSGNNTVERSIANSCLLSQIGSTTDIPVYDASLRAEMFYFIKLKDILTYMKYQCRINLRSLDLN